MIVTKISDGGAHVIMVEREAKVLYRALLLAINNDQIRVNGIDHNQLLKELAAIADPVA